MGIDGQLKQISVESLELCRNDSSLMELFFAAKRLPESAFWQREENDFIRQEDIEDAKQDAHTRYMELTFEEGEKQSLKPQFLSEWDIPELDLDSNWQALTFLLAGYIPGYMASEWTIPELRPEGYGQPKSLWEKVSEFFKPYEHQDFLTFLVIPNSEWDSLPLVNAFGAGTSTAYRAGYEFVRYLLPHQMEELLEGLTTLGERGFQNRFQIESQKVTPCPWIDWSETDMLDWLTDYYREIVAYYQDAISRQNAMLLYIW